MVVGSYKIYLDGIWVSALCYPEWNKDKYHFIIFYQYLDEETQEQLLKYDGVSETTHVLHLIVNRDFVANKEFRAEIIQRDEHFIGVCNELFKKTGIPTKPGCPIAYNPIMRVTQRFMQKILDNFAGEQWSLSTVIPEYHPGEIFIPLDMFRILISDIELIIADIDFFPGEWDTCVELWDGYTFYNLDRDKMVTVKTKELAGKEKYAR